MDRKFFKRFRKNGNGLPIPCYYNPVKLGHFSASKMLIFLLEIKINSVQVNNLATKREKKKNRAKFDSATDLSRFRSVFFLYFRCVMIANTS